MHVIPVLDLADSVVVLAKGGRREDYRPIDTPLCPDPTPLLVVESMLKLFPFDKFYIADLDSIEGKSSNANSIVSLAHSYPAI
ncbi:MAG TPA: nickel transporter, partial [Gammaproteobacteria bacterium]|nr:nickel transporter [Gammaproteobacteria bacterium]